MKEQPTAKAKKKLTAHRGMATWGERLVPLADFRRAARGSGVDLAPHEKQVARSRFLETPRDTTPVEGPWQKIAIFGGVYNNSYSLRALLEDCRERGVEAIYCLGDLGGFGPNPESIWPLLEAGGVRVLQGNYEQSLAADREDCNCGYADPRDNHFAELSYRYTEKNCSPAFKRWMGALPARRRVRIGERELLLVHGSPRRVNEFLFHSTTPESFLEVILEQERCEGFLCTHTGLPWYRRLPSGREVINVGVIGRPPNDGRPEVTYTILHSNRPQGSEVQGFEVEQIRLQYDYFSLAEDMREQNLPPEFVDTIISGWWTTCLEILPQLERKASRF